MNFVFPVPYTLGEWLAWIAAAVTVGLGLMVMLAPRLSLRALWLGAVGGRNCDASFLRGQIGGFYVGIGISAILFAQPLIYLTLGFAWALAAIGWVLSLLTDRSAQAAGWINLLVAVALAAAPLSFALGIIP